MHGPCFIEKAHILWPQLIPERIVGNRPLLFAVLVAHRRLTPGDRTGLTHLAPPSATAA
jgi:hypothetical protein